MTPATGMMSPILHLLPVFSIVALSLARGAEIGTKRDVIRGPVRERLSLTLFITTGFLVAAGSIAEYLLRGRGVSWPALAAGWTLGLLSFVVRRQSIAALGRFWSLHVEIRETHEFVQSGPFRFVRHPVYFSMILELLAMALMGEAWLTAMLAPFLFIPVLLGRVRMEERAMVEKFGERYREYQRTTPAIFPRPW